jgi:Na+/H+ antiporter NhaD/arsenite permease-like protein
MLRFVKSQPVLVIAFIAAAVTMFFVPPDRGYIGYINYTVLIELFALMTAVAGLRGAGIFERATDIMLAKAGTKRRLGAVFILLCFFSSMLVTNDVALITFVPLTLLVYSKLSDERSLIITIVLETAAANMGSMLTPVGNPQNLYIYDEFQLSALTFLRATLPAGALSLALLLALTLLLPKTACSGSGGSDKAVSKIPAAAFSALFMVCLLTVFRLIPAWVCLAAAVVVAAAVNYRVLAKVDYALLATFVCFFVFVGNIARIGAVSSFFSDILAGRELIVGILLSQVISNVPAAVMLSGFTDNGVALLLGVDIGGLGTIIASLASLISFQFYRKSENAKPGKYLLAFTGVSIVLLVPLVIMQLIIM